MAKKKPYYLLVAHSVDKLKSLIKEYGRWAPLKDYVTRIEAYLHTDFGIVIENSKSILESISKEICDDKLVKLSNNESISSTLKKACKAIGYNGGDLVTQLSTSIANIGHQMGNLRNEMGSTAHGRTMSQLKDRNDGIDEITKEFLVDTTELVSCFLIKNYENENPRKPQESLTESLEYIKEDNFNEHWDELYGDFIMDDYSYTASEILFNVDNQAYVNEFKVYKETQ